MYSHPGICDIIDIANFTRLDERTVYQAINETGTKYVDWTAREESDGAQPILHLYIEIKQSCDHSQLARSFHDNLRKIDPFYNDLAHLKPPHMNATDEMIRSL